MTEDIDKAEGLTMARKEANGGTSNRLPRLLINAQQAFAPTAAVEELHGCRK